MQMEIKKWFIVTENKFYSNQQGIYCYGGSGEKPVVESSILAREAFLKLGWWYFIPKQELEQEHVS